MDDRQAALNWAWEASAQAPGLNAEERQLAATSFGFVSLYTSELVPIKSLGFYSRILVPIKIVLRFPVALLAEPAETLSRLAAIAQWRQRVEGAISALFLTLVLLLFPLPRLFYHEPRSRDEAVAPNIPATGETP